MKPPEVSIAVTDLSLRFPVYGVDAKSLKKNLARVTVGGRLGSSNTGATEVTALSNISFNLRDRKSVVEGKSVDLGGRRIIKKKKKKHKIEYNQSTHEYNNST